MNGSHYLGKRVSDLALYDKIGPITGVALIVDEENEVFSGNDSGYVLEAECPYATQEIADAVLQSLVGYSYQGFQATGAELSIDAELGDAISVDGNDSMLAYQKLNFGPGHMSEIAAPRDNAVDHEYPYLGSTNRAARRTKAELRSLINKTSEAILLEVSGLNGEVTRLKVAIDGVTITDENGTTLIKGSSIDTDTLNLSGKITFGDLTAELQTELDAVVTKADAALNAAATSSQVVSGWTYTGTTYIDGRKIATDTIYASRLLGGSVSLLTSSKQEAGVIGITGADTASYAVEIASHGALRLTAAVGAAYMESTSHGTFLTCDYFNASGGNFGPQGTDKFSLGLSNRRWSEIYASTSTISTSDRNAKNSIEELPEEYLAMFSLITPKRFKLNAGTSGRYHVGFIAQEVEEAMASVGLSSLEFAGFVKDKDDDGNDIYMLRYEEFIGILAAKIKQLESRMTETEE